MEKINVTHEQMIALEKLAETNLKVSEAKNALSLLKKQEIEYIEEREKKTLDRIQVLFDESKQIIAQTKKNYEEVHTFNNTVISFSDALCEMHTKFSDILKDFDTREQKWSQEVTRQEKEALDIRKMLKQEEARLENEKKNLDKSFKKLEDEKTKLKDERETLSRAIERLKKNKI